MGHPPSAGADPFRARLVAAFRWVDPGPWSAHYLTDRSGWWRDPTLLAGLGPRLADLFARERPSVVVAPATSGFLLGPLVAQALGTGFVEAYRDLSGAELADQLLVRTCAPDHAGRVSTFGVRARHLARADRVLVVDDWVETGAQLAALAGIVADAGAHYLGAAVVVDAAPTEVRAALTVRGLLRARDLDQRHRP